MEFNKDKIKYKIAISKIKEENDIVMKNKSKNIFKTIITTILSLTLGTGVVFAGAKVYENIWKEPEKISEITTEITEESKKENITEEEAKEIAIRKLEEVGFNSNIVNTNHYKEIDSNKIMFRFDTEDNYEISIDGVTGNFFDIWNNNQKIQDTNKMISREEAIEEANKLYKLFGFKEGEYEISSVYANNIANSNESEGFKFDVKYNKKYGNLYNPYEMICVSIESKNKDFDYFRVFNVPCDNNEIVITEEKAIELALKEDEKVKTNNVESTKAQLMIVAMNSDSYERINDTEKYYREMQEQDYSLEERNYYFMEDRIRKAWVVVLNYEDNFDGDIVKRYTEGKYSYFIDATTGEVIGGATMDYIYSESVNYNN